MKPSELYAMTPERVTNDLTYIAQHVPEAGEAAKSRLENDFLPEDFWSGRVEVRLLKDHCFDGRRVWQLATVWFDGTPVMVVQNAGREGRDHRARFVTDSLALLAMCRFIESQLRIPEPLAPGRYYTEDEDIPGIDEFYGNKLGGYFAHNW